MQIITILLRIMTHFNMGVLLAILLWLVWKLS